MKTHLGCQQCFLPTEEIVFFCFFIFNFYYFLKFLAKGGGSGNFWFICLKND
ncbi:hypothetical protein CPC197_2279 [Chlamydia psittaci C1/97]|nr:hypothetical protein CPC197_2279 [Chlamydia psittaci C1/97]